MTKQLRRADGQHMAAGWFVNMDQVREVRNQADIFAHVTTVDVHAVICALADLGYVTLADAEVEK